MRGEKSTFNDLFKTKNNDDNWGAINTAPPYIISSSSFSILHLLGSIKLNQPTLLFLLLLLSLIILLPSNSTKPHYCCCFFFFFTDRQSSWIIFFPRKPYIHKAKLFFIFIKFFFLGCDLWTWFGCKRGKEKWDIVEFCD